jgi:hydrogenase nickel incorporation protein HypB
MSELITIEQKILKKNGEIAAEIRHALDERGILAVGLVSAPGSGKTSLLEKTLSALRSQVRAAVIEGDVQTDRDARRIADLGIPVIQIVTNGTCHLEARMVQEALDRLPAHLDLVFIENVGNLVCPASYDLGEHLRVVLTSTPEGEDKPIKYPALFRSADALVINKVDLLPYVPYDMVAAKLFAHQVNPDLVVFETSCLTGENVSVWAEWLLGHLEAHRAALPALAR